MSCPDCFSGSTHKGNPSGEVTTLHGLKVYTAKPSDGVAPRGIIIIIPDAFGWEFVNNRLLADHYAEKGGYVVYLPEFMNGHSASLTLLTSTQEVMKTSGIIGWIKAPYYVASIIFALVPFAYYNRFGLTRPVINAFFKDVRDNEGAELPMYAAGFCWGGKHTVNLASSVETATDGKPLIDAGFTGHPSQLDIPLDINNMTIPVSFALAEKDRMLQPPAIETIRQIVESRPEAERGEVKVYKGAGHGFCIRADVIQEDASKQAAEAEDQALAWFDKHRP